MGGMPVPGSLLRSQWGKPALLLIFTLFFYWKVLFTGRYMFPWDVSDFFYPFLSFVHEELRHFRMPLWDPYSMSGFPIIGDPEAQIFYPINWLFVLLRPFSPLPYKIVEVVEVAHFYLAGVFMYWLAREYTRDDLAALLGGVLFMSSGAMVAHTEHFATVEAMAWYPLVFLLARRGLLEKDLRWTAASGFFMGMEILVGHLQHSVYLGLLLLLYFAYEACAGPSRRRLWPHWIFHLCTIAAIGAGLALVQLVPTWQLGGQSIRSNLTFWDVTVGNDIAFLWTLFLPNMFGGLSGVPYAGIGDISFNYVFLTVPGCLLAFIGLVAMIRRRDFFWLGLVLLSVELSLGRGGVFGTLVYRTPVLNLFRQMQVFFDLGNFALCLMAAVGLRELLEQDRRAFHRRWIVPVFIALLVAAAGIGQLYGLAARIHGWYHMLAALALSAVVLTLWLHGLLRSRPAAVSLMVLMVFEICYYSRDKWFNLEARDPRTYLAFDYAFHRRQSLEYLRSDRATDFRVAAFDGSPWGGNGCNVWRLPGIFGWNPVMLRNYQDFIRQAILTNYHAQPKFTDHRIESPLIDLLGVKYLLVNGPTEEYLRLSESRKLEKVFAEPNWRVIYRNKEYLSRSWFFPRAYVVPDRGAVLALLNSGWFDSRRTLLFAAPDLQGGTLLPVEPLTVVTLLPEEVSAASAGHAESVPDCAEARTAFKYWRGKGNWIRFEIGGLEPGRYAVLAEYVAAGPVPPVLATELYQGGRRQSVGATVLMRTGGWACRTTRSAELGQFELSAAAATITITHEQDSPVDLFALRLVRLPGEASPEPLPQQQAGDSSRTTADDVRESSFGDFDVTANSYAFTANLKRGGFVLVNEIYYPGWQALVGGKPVQILRADHAFRALALPPGSHRIVMRFRPPYLLLAGLLSLITLAGLFAFFVFQRRRAQQPGL